jgi:hypothetical protein
MDVVKAAQLSGRTLERVVVHPLVLLSIVDHYNRVARDTRKRVVGVLLGTSSRGSVDVTNSYAGKPPNNPRLLSVARVCAARGGRFRSRMGLLCCLGFFAESAAGVDAIRSIDVDCPCCSCVID